MKLARNQVEAHRCLRLGSMSSAISFITRKPSSEAPLGISRAMYLLKHLTCPDCRFLETEIRLLPDCGRITGHPESGRPQRDLSFRILLTLSELPTVRKGFVNAALLQANNHAAFGTATLQRAGPPRRATFNISPGIRQVLTTSIPRTGSGSLSMLPRLTTVVELYYSSSLLLPTILQATLTGKRCKRESHVCCLPYPRPAPP
jgi:hypothetical protein